VGPDRVQRRRTGRGARDVCYFAIGHILQIPAQENLAEQMEKFLDERIHHDVFFMPYQDRFRVSRRLAYRRRPSRHYCKPVREYPAIGKDSDGAPFIPGKVVVFTKEAP
jgi:hypothetical protein